MKKISLVLAIILAITMLFAGCANTNSEEATNGANENQNELKQVVIGLNADYSTFDPNLSYEKSADMILHAIYDTLLAFDTNVEGSVKPHLAESWTISDDKKVYTFKLREDVTFTSGNKLTANDVKYSFERLDSLIGNPSFLMDGVKSVDVISDYEVAVTLEKVDPSLLVKLTKVNFSILDSAVVLENGGNGDPEKDTAQEYLDNASAGSGPFTLESYTPNAELVLIKNENYWGTPANIDRVVYKQISEPSMQMMSLTKGDIDFALDLESEQIELISTEDNISVVEHPTQSVFFLLLNADSEIGGPLADPLVRKAIKYALDYDGINELAGNGGFTPYGFIPVGLESSLGKSEITRDLVKAKALLAEAGYPDGFSVDCGVIPDMAPDGVSFMTMGLKAQSDLAEIGIKVNIISEEVSIYLENYRSGKHQMNVSMWSPDYIDPAAQLPFVAGNSVALRANWTADMAPELAKLASDAAVEIDPAKRKAFFEEIQVKYNEVTGPFIMLVQPGRRFAVSNRIENVVYNPAFDIDLTVLDVK